MEQLKIKGNAPLGGSIRIHGAKNSVLPILAASLLIDGESVIHNCPDLSDVKTTIDILNYLGADAKRENDTIIVNSRGVNKWDIPEHLMKEMRSSIIFLGSICSKMGNAKVFLPGGCEIGLRPIDIHLNSLSQLGYLIDFDGLNIICKRANTKANKIALPFPSVGATENIILASCLIEGTTYIVNAAREPEIEDLACFLNKAGANITGAGSTVIKIDGVKRLNSVEHTIIPDRILASTFMSASVITKSILKLDDIVYKHLIPITPAFKEMGCNFKIDNSSLIIYPPKTCNEVKLIKTMPYPGFPTDCQAPVMACLTTAKGTSIINETIFESRFKHISQLNRFGSDITVHDRIAIIKGVDKLHSTSAFCTDLRGGASVVICALASEGESIIKDIYHIDRGYENIENQLASIGASIKRFNDEKEE